MNSQRRIGIVLSYALILINAIVGFLYVPLLLKYLGENEYGLYQLIGSLVGYFAVMDFGLSATTTRFYSKYLAKNDTLNMENTLGISQLIYYILSFLSILILSIVYLNLDNIFGNSLSIYEIEESKKMFIFLTINIFITLLTNIYTSVITSHEKFVFLKGLSIIQIVLQPILVVTVISKAPYAIAITAVIASLNFIASIIKIVYFKIKIKIRIKLHYFDKALFYNILSFSFSIFVVSVVDQLFWRSSQFILGMMMGTSAVAVYSVASQIYMNYMPLSTVIQGVFLPQITKLVELKASSEYLSNLFIKIGRIQYLLLSTILLGFILFGKEFIFLWVGSSYQSAYLLSLIIIVPFTIDLIQNIGLIIMQARDQYSFRAKLMVLMCLINFILVYFLTKKYGLVGTASATGITMFIGNGLVMNIYYKKAMNLNISKFWINIMKITIPSIFSFSVIWILKKIIVIDNLALLIGMGVLFVVLHGLILWRYALNDYEKKIFITYVNRFLKCFNLNH